jgi:hypothetical protein
MNATKREYRISNKEGRMLKLLGQRKNFIIRNSLFDIRYSLKAHGKFIILELPTAEGLAKHLPSISRILSEKKEGAVQFNPETENGKRKTGNPYYTARPES